MAPKRRRRRHRGPARLGQGATRFVCPIIWLFALMLIYFLEIDLVDREAALAGDGLARWGLAVECSERGLPPPPSQPPPATQPSPAKPLVQTSAARPPANKTSGAGAQTKWRRKQQENSRPKPVNSEAQSEGPGARPASQTNRRVANNWRPSKSFRRQQQQLVDESQTEPNATESQLEPAAADEQLPVSITPRVGLVRVPVESNAILKCLVSAQTGRQFARGFKVRWSRFMYDENVYEQIETSTGLRDVEPDGRERPKRDDEQQTAAVAEPPTTPAPQLNRQLQLRDFLSRSRQETNKISELLIEATLSISPVRASDNATYYCAASDNNQARIDLLALSRPVVWLQRVAPARDSKSALVLWSVQSDGNTPIKRTILMVRNDSQSLGGRAGYESPRLGGGGAQRQPSVVVLDSDYTQWQRLDIPHGGEPYVEGEPTRPAWRHQSDGHSGAPPDSLGDVDIVSTASAGHSSDPAGAHWPARNESFAPPAGSRPRHHLRAFNLTALLPGVTYQLKLAAVNDMGQSEWSRLNATMPNEIPAQITDVFLLSQTSDSLAIGWRRPPYDGAKTLRYEMQLFDLNRTLTLDANTNTTTAGALANQTSARTNFMYYFVNLNQGTDYHFHVRACSRAGCGAYSSPKLLASTLDGEPDEPLDVELACNQPAAGLSVSWLPPANVRGKLLNYSVTVEASARFRNQSNQWQTDEWRTTLDTADNHTLSLELANALLPNTNYSARVCANNRARRCGKLSQPTSRSQCQSEPELPDELPQGLRLALRPAGRDELGQPETLVLELPNISQRNGSIDCLQLVLIRLPGSFRNQSAGHSRALSEYLPDDPAEVSFDEFRPADAEQRRAGPDVSGQQPESSFAYLAEELNLSATEAIAGQLSRDLVLGDGRQEAGACRSMFARLHANGNTNQFVEHPQAAKTGRPSRQKSAPETGRTRRILRPLDGALSSLTYYTGFLKLCQLRPRFAAGSARHPGGPSVGQRERGGSTGPDEHQARFELLTKYSNYFSPVRTGAAVLQPEPSPMLDLDGQYESGESPESNFCSLPLVESLQSRLFGSQRPCQATREFGELVRRKLTSFYSNSLEFLADNAPQVESLNRLMKRSSQPMQALEIGALVLGLTLTLLLLAYLVTLPAKLRRRRKTKVRRKLNEHEQQHLQRAQLEPALAEKGHQFGQQTNLQALASSMGYQQVAEPLEQRDPNFGPNVSGDTNHVGCPIHSSPMAGAGQRRQSAALASPVRQPDESLHEPGAQVEVERDQSCAELDGGQCPAHHAHNAHHHHHHHHAHRHPETQHQQQQHAGWAADGEHQLDNYARNCRTMRRVNSGQTGPANEAQPGLCAAQQQRPHHQQAGAARLNLTMQHNSVLAFAKKINKAVPLNLFQAVFECRLKNGWLREEYEQLPSQVQQQAAASADAATNGTGSGAAEAKGAAGNRFIRLRPQLVVSRDDSISALISGNEQFDGSLVRMKLPSCLTSEQATQLAQFERQLICAKSPLDADSVWDFWRLVYEREVATIVMLTPTEDSHTGELRCAQYWPTCDNEETTILSPCNEFVQQSSILPAKFNIRQETLNVADEAAGFEHEFKLRQLTLMVMATRPADNEPGAPDSQPGEPAKTSAGSDTERDADDDDDRLVIVERTILHFQFLHWNTSSPANQIKLIKFIELVNERHSRALQQQASPGVNWQQLGSSSPILVHCANGLGRSGLFCAMSLVIDDLKLKLALIQKQQQWSPSVRLNLFQLVARMRQQRDMLLCPYRFYELLYYLTSRCIPSQEQALAARQQQHPQDH